jgi:heterotetrameric sarcosine oxidase gamma subunit
MRRRLSLKGVRYLRGSGLAAGRGELRPGAVIRERSRVTVQLKSWMPGRTSPSFAAPTVPAACRLLPLAPGEWLLISDTLAAHALREHARHIQQHGIAAVESTPGLAAIQVEGAAALDVLANGCGLDLRSPDFVLGTCTRTRLAQLPIILDYVDVKPRFELYIGRSYLSYMCSWLDDAAVGIQGSRRL